MRKVSYLPLWHLLLERGMTKSQMRIEAGLTTNVLANMNPKGKKEKHTGRVSIKEKLAEKKAVIEQRDKAGKDVPEKGTEKKTEREI